MMRLVRMLSSTLIDLRMAVDPTHDKEGPQASESISNTRL